METLEQKGFGLRLKVMWIKLSAYAPQGLQGKHPDYGGIGRFCKAKWNIVAPSWTNPYSPYPETPDPNFPY